MRYFLYFILCLITFQGHAQLGLCQGIKGEIMFHENFGDGLGIGTPLPPGVSSYFFTNNFPEIGQYTIRSNSIPNLEVLPDPDSWLWHLLTNDWSNTLFSSPGKMLLINANEISGTFYKKSINNLCELTSYEFSFWGAPLYRISSNNCTENEGLGVPINIRLEVWDITETQLLSFAETGNINNSSIINFQQYGLIFNTQPNQTEVIIKIINNNLQPGCGNDLVLDEINVQVCAGNSTLTSIEYEDENPLFCEEDTPVNINLNIENSYVGNYFIWQKSNDGQLWINIDDTPILNTGGNFTVNLSDIEETTYYRVKFASTSNNLINNNPDCLWFSNTYFVQILSSSDAPVSFSSNVSYCGDSVIPALAVLLVENLTVNWYDSPIGGNLLLSNSFSYVPPAPGTYYAAYYSEEFPCLGDIRTPITLSWYPGIEVSTNPPAIVICGGEGAILDAIHPNSIYEWEPSSLGNEQFATVYEPGVYVVTIRDPLSACSEARTRTFIVNGYQNPVISNISHSGSTLFVTMAFEDVYEYSIDGVVWQSSNIFENVETGLINVYVRDIIDCGMDQQQYILFPNPPKFFTPNGDNSNDFFTIKNIAELNLVIKIFDRYGKLITILNSSNKEWDGTYNGSNIPSSDYWYKVFMNGKELMSGHFSLKR